MCLYVVCACMLICVYGCGMCVCVVVWGVCTLARCARMEAKGQRQSSSITRHVILRQGLSLELTIPDWLTASLQDLSVSVQRPCCYTALLPHPTFKWVQKSKLLSSLYPLNICCFQPLNHLPSSLVRKLACKVD